MGIGSELMVSVNIGSMVRRERVVVAGVGRLSGRGDEPSSYERMGIGWDGRCILRLAVLFEVGYGLAHHSAWRVSRRQ